jgi:GT2 family glycosyltransferase
MTQPIPLVWIVIPTWNRSADLQECLSAVRRLSYANFRTVVVDNGSTDDTREAVRQKFPEVDLIALRTNQGAPVASNAGFQHALDHGAAYALRLDSDTVVAGDFLSRLVTVAEGADDIGGLVGTVYYYHEPGRIWSMGARRTSFFFDTRDVAHGGPPRLAPDEPHDIDYAWSAGILLSRRALELTRGFDPDFFVYYEEMDFCERLRDAGLRLCLVPGAHMWHKVGELETGPRLAYNWAQGKMLFYRKHSRGLRLMLLVLYAYAYALGRTVRPKAQGGNRGPLGAVLRGLTAGLTQRLAHRHIG